MATDQYAVLYSFVDQQLLTEEMDVDLDYNPDLKPVSTQAKGFAGVTKGAGSMTATVTSALPRAGIEKDYFELARLATPVEFIIVMANKKLVSKGFITGVKVKGGVSQETRVDFTFHGEEPKLVN